MNEIKAIETTYNGYKFRSRLEARWAVFFDACGIKYEYEPEGYVLDDGVCYLPDFLLHGIEAVPGGKVYVEVKGYVTEKDIDKVRKFGKSGNPIVMVGNIPKCNNYDDFHNDILEMHNNNLTFTGFSENGNEATVGFAFDNDDRFTVFREDFIEEYTINVKKTLSAYKKARSARFEFNDSKSVTTNTITVKAKTTKRFNDYILPEYHKYCMDDICPIDNIYDVETRTYISKFSTSLKGTYDIIKDKYGAIPKGYHVVPLETHFNPGSHFLVNIPEEVFEETKLYLNDYERYNVALAACYNFLLGGSKEYRQSEFITMFLHAQLEYCATEYKASGDVSLIPGTDIPFPFGIRTINKNRSIYLSNKRRMVVGWKENYEKIMPIVETNIKKYNGFNEAAFLITANKVLPEPLRTLICSDNEYEINKLLSDDKYKMTNANKSKCVVRI